MYWRLQKHCLLGDSYFFVKLFTLTVSQEGQEEQQKGTS